MYIMTKIINVCLLKKMGQNPHISVAHPKIGAPQPNLGAPQNCLQPDLIRPRIPLRPHYSHAHTREPGHLWPQPQPRLRRLEPPLLPLAAPTARASSTAAAASSRRTPPVPGRASAMTAASSRHRLARAAVRRLPLAATASTRPVSTTSLQVSLHLPPSFLFPVIFLLPHIFHEC